MGGRKVSTGDRAGGAARMVLLSGSGSEGCKAEVNTHGKRREYDRPKDRFPGNTEVGR